MLIPPRDTPTPTTQIAAVIGDPVSHSLSPRLHNARFDALGLDWIYIACRVPDGQGEEAVADMRAKGFQGLSVTMPHKAAAARAVDELSPTAAKLGVVNCVRREGDRLIGENTDGIGFLDGLRAQTNIEPDGLRVVIVGAGGAARSVALTLAEHGASIGVSNRTRTSSEELVHLIGGSSSVVEQEAISDADLVINATPLGMNDNEPMPIDVNLLGTGQCVVDLIYKPEKTKLLIEAETRGLQVLNGLGMLLFQAGEQFRLWTGSEAPISAMADAVGVTLDYW